MSPSKDMVTLLPVPSERETSSASFTFLVRIYDLEGFRPHDSSGLRPSLRLLGFWVALKTRLKRSFSRSRRKSVLDPARNPGILEFLAPSSIPPALGPRSHCRF